MKRLSATTRYAELWRLLQQQPTAREPKRLRVVRS
jgi:hypothetical protein